MANHKVMFGMECSDTHKIKSKHYCAKCNAKHYGTMGETMSEFKHGELHSGSKKGPKVTSRKQAIAIGMNQERKAKHHAKIHKPTVAGGALAGAALGGALVGGMASKETISAPHATPNKPGTPHVPSPPKAAHESGRKPPMLTPDAFKPAHRVINSGPQSKPPQKHHEAPKPKSQTSIPAHKSTPRKPGESWSDFQNRLKGNDNSPGRNIGIKVPGKPYSKKRA